MAFNAGDIVFRIMGKDEGLTAALDKAKGQFATASKAMGAAMTAVGGTITAFVGKSVYDFAQLGDELDKMAGRTGFSTNALGELKYAAEQSGATLGDIEKASKRLSTTIYEAGQGTATYTEALGALGLQYSDLSGLSPEQQFLTVAYALADVQDASVKAALAQQVFGRAGTQLFPMLAQGRAGLEALRAEAVRLGLSLDGEATTAAVEFGDRMQDAGLALRSLSLEVAQVLLPELTALAIWVKEAAISFREWRQEHPELVANLTKVAAAAGAIMVALGPILIALPGLAVAFGGVVTAVKAVIAVFGVVAAAISAPVTLILAATAAIGLAAYGVYKDWENVKGLLIRTWEALKSAFELIFAPVIAAWKMIQNAVGYTPTGALNQGALDRYRNGIQASTAAGGSDRYTGGGMREAPANAGVGLAGMGGVTIQNMTIVTDDPKEASRTLAESLELELRGMGLLYG